MPVAYRDQSTASAAANGTTVTINKPAGLVSGDYMLCSISYSGADTNMSTIPSPWVLVNSSVVSTTMTHFLYAAFAGASEPASYSFVRATTGSWASVIVCYSGVTSRDAAAIDTEGGVSDTTILIPALTTTDANDMEVAAAAHHSGTTTGTTYSFPGGWNLRAQLEPVAATKRNTVVGDRLLTALNPAAFDITATLAGAHVGQSAALKPGSSDVTPPAAPTGLSAVVVNE